MTYSWTNTDARKTLKCSNSVCKRKGIVFFHVIKNAYLMPIVRLLGKSELPLKQITGVSARPLLSPDLVNGKTIENPAPIPGRHKISIFS